MRASTVAFSLSGVCAEAAVASANASTRQTTAEARRAIPLFSPMPGSTLPGIAVECLQRRGHVAAQRADLRPVVHVRDRARPVLELELLERPQRPVSLLEELEPAPFVLIELVELIRLGLGLADERQRDRDHAYDGKR